MTTAEIVLRLIGWLTVALAYSCMAVSAWRELCHRLGRRMFGNSKREETRQ